jgi:hypothetical protein
MLHALANPGGGAAASSAAGQQPQFVIGGEQFVNLQVRITLFSSHSIPGETAQFVQSVARKVGVLQKIRG